MRVQRYQATGVAAQERDRRRDLRQLPPDGPLAPRRGVRESQGGRPGTLHRDAGEGGCMKRWLALLRVFHRLAELERQVELLDGAVYRVECNVISLDEATPGWDDICRVEHRIKAVDVEDLVRRLDNLAYWTAPRHHSHDASSRN
jgi:hypothetical protein